MGCGPSKVDIEAMIETRIAELKITIQAEQKEMCDTYVKHMDELSDLRTRIEELEVRKEPEPEPYSWLFCPRSYTT